MAAFNFKARFAHDVDHGIKRQTIRANRKHMPKVGERAHLFTMMRTKHCRRLRAQCNDYITISQPLRITQGGIELIINDSFIAMGELDDFAIRDGFKNWPEMRDFFATEHGLPFHGFLVRW